MGSVLSELWLDRDPRSEGVGTDASAAKRTPQSIGFDYMRIVVTDESKIFRIVRSGRLAIPVMAREPNIFQLPKEARLCFLRGTLDPGLSHPGSMLILRAGVRFTSCEYRSQ
jgi:hypothetical protein